MPSDGTSTLWFDLSLSVDQPPGHLPPSPLLRLLTLAGWTLTAERTAEGGVEVTASKDGKAVTEHGRSIPDVAVPIFVGAMRTREAAT